jgi:hypothetical protein
MYPVVPSSSGGFSQFHSLPRKFRGGPQQQMMMPHMQPNPPPYGDHYDYYPAQDQMTVGPVDPYGNYGELVVDAWLLSIDEILLLKALHFHR